VELHPNVNDPVLLRDHADREYESQVEDLGVGLLVVAQPSGLPDHEVFSTGTELNVAWTDADGDVQVLPTRIMAAHLRGTLPVWSLVATGPALAEQRRRLERFPASGPVTLRSAAGNDTHVVTGSLVDISEAAIRCAVEAGTADGFLGSVTEVTAEFRVGTVDFLIAGRAEFLRATKHPADLEELVVLFDEPVAEAEALREQIAILQAQPPAPAEDDQ
jgi:hypothetical protein